MTSAEHSASSPSNRSWVLDWPREVLRQARVAFGVRGVAWALAAAFFGLAFGAIAFVLIPLRTPQIGVGDAAIDEFRAVENAHLDFMAILAGMATGAVEWKPGERPAGSALLSDAPMMTSTHSSGL